MDEKYLAITHKLKSDENLSLSLWLASINYGITNGRRVDIYEPNPNKGRLCGEGDQQYREGERRPHPRFSVRARNAAEGLMLLNRKCAGEDGVEHTISSGWERDEKVHGDPEPSPGIDGWLYAGFGFSVFPEEGHYVARMRGGSLKPIVVATGPIASVDDAIATFEAVPVMQELLHSLYRGCTLRERLVGRNLGILSEAYAETAMFSDEFREEYENALKGFGVVKLTDDGKNALLLSMVLSRLCEFDKQLQTK